MITKNEQYEVYNYGGSPIAVSTKNETILIPGSDEGEAGTYPLYADEISFINNNSKVFKNGALRFNKDIESEMYEFLRIRNWEDILTNTQIEEIIANPTAEGLEKIISITDLSYYERIYGIFLGLWNAGIPISNKVEKVFKNRRKEFLEGKYTTSITITQSEDNGESKKMKEMADELASLKELIKTLQAEKQPEKVETKEPVVEEKKPKTTAKRTTKKATNKATK